MVVISQNKNWIQREKRFSSCGCHFPSAVLQLLTSWYCLSKMSVGWSSLLPSCPCRLATNYFVKSKQFWKGQTKNSARNGVPAGAASISQKNHRCFRADGCLNSNFIAYCVVTCLHWFASGPSSNSIEFYSAGRRSVQQFTGNPKQFQKDWLIVQAILVFNNTEYIVQHFTTQCVLCKVFQQ